MSDITKMVYDDARLTTVQVIYFMPDHHSLVQEFIWQTLDVPPRFQRIHKFLNYWRSHIEAVIKEINLTYAGNLIPVRFKTVSDIFQA